MEPSAFRYVFGPVLSGRLGRSLGLDLLGSRVCSMNCVYCESGRLERLTLERAPYVPAAALLAELAAWDQARRTRGEPLPDVVTLGGMGEPTLNTDLPAIIRGVRGLLPLVPVAVLTNASLMTDPQVRAELALADLVLPSLDALTPDEFLRVNRGHPDLDPQAIAEGILAFAQGYAGRLCLEILLVAGVNDSEANLELLAAYCQRLQPQRVDVVTLSRPGAEAWARPVDAAALARWRGRLGPVAQAKTSAVAGLAGSAEKGQEQQGAMSGLELRARILASLARRPQTAAQLASALLAEPEAVERALTELLTLNQAEVVRPDAEPQGCEASAPAYYQARH